MYIYIFISNIYIYIYIHTYVNRNFKKVVKSNVNRSLLEPTPNEFSQPSWSS